MTKQPTDSKYQLKISHIGPIASLDGTVSNQKRNFIFAANGTGKSFISRTLQLLELSSDEVSDKKDELINNFCQEESSLDESCLKLTQGNETLAQITFSKKLSRVDIEKGEKIISVFNSQYVEREVRNKNEFTFQDTIEGELIIGHDTAELKRAEDALKTLSNNYENSKNDLQKKHNDDTQALLNDTSIDRRLQDFQSLSLDKHIGGKINISNLNVESTTTQFVQEKECLKKYEELPDNPEEPVLIELPSLTLGLNEIQCFLSKPVNLSTIGEDLKRQIDERSEFIKAGTGYIEEKDSNCPFCKQRFDTNAKNLIDTYVAYFTDAEASAKDKCRQFKGICAQLNTDLDRLQNRYIQSSQQYDTLKSYFPQLLQTQLDGIISTVDQIKRLNDVVIQWIEIKENDLATDYDYTMECGEQERTRNELLQDIERIVNQSNQHIKKLTSTLKNIPKAKRETKRNVCEKFEQDFHAKHMDEFKNLSNLKTKFEEQTLLIDHLKNTSPNKASIEERVFTTFQELLKKVFDDKYTFDQQSRSIKLHNKPIKRGADKTFSDGEKNIIGLCFFIAELHKKVSRNDDYKKLFLVIDDPVSSLSYNYIYSVLDILKTLRVNDETIIFNTKDPHVPILLLTHNEQLFNMIFSNGIFKKEAAFQLSQNEQQHGLIALQQIIMPYYEQLQHILNVSNKTETPQYYTPNAIRSVIESIWKFTKPDIQDLGGYFRFLSKEGIHINSIMLNNLSHGHFDNSSFCESHVIDAAKKTINIVNKFAPGQTIKLNGHQPQLIATKNSADEEVKIFTSVALPGSAS